MKLFHQRLDVTKSDRIQTEHQNIFSNGITSFLSHTNAKVFLAFSECSSKYFTTKSAMSSFHTRPKWSRFNINKEQILFIKAVSGSFHFDEMHHTIDTQTETHYFHSVGIGSDEFHSDHGYVNSIHSNCNANLHFLMFEEVHEMQHECKTFEFGNELIHQFWERNMFEWICCYSYYVINKFLL